MFQNILQSGRKKENVGAFVLFSFVQTLKAYRLNKKMMSGPILITAKIAVPLRIGV